MFKQTAFSIILIGLLCIPMNMYIIHMAFIGSSDDWSSVLCQFIVSYCFGYFSTDKILGLLLKDEVE